MADTRVMTWQGRPVTDLSREELVEALEWAAREIERLHMQGRNMRDVLTGKAA